MEKVKVIRKNGRIIALRKETVKDKISAYVKATMLISLSMIVFGTINLYSYSVLRVNARNNEALRQELNILKKENSNLEEIKANLMNIKEIQKKAESLGFVYNTKVNYIK